MSSISINKNKETKPRKTEQDKSLNTEASRCKRVKMTNNWAKVTICKTILRLSNKMPVPQGYNKKI